VSGDEGFKRWRSRTPILVNFEKAYVSTNINPMVRV